MSFLRIQYFIVYIIIFSISQIAYSQYESRGKEYNFVDAEYFLFNHNYYDALDLYTILNNDYPKIKDYIFKKGICHLELNNAEQAIEDILNSKKKKKTPNNYSYYLARAYALNYQFDSAIIVFNEALEATNVDSKLKKQIPHLISQCNNGKIIVKNRLNITTVNIGSPINTSDNEYSPVVNADESVMAFTYRGGKSLGGRQSIYMKPEGNGNYYEDVYISYKENTKWSTPELIRSGVNTNMSEAPVSMSPDGQILYVYRDTEFNSGDLFYINKTKNGWGEMQELPINSSSWEGSISVAPNGLLAVFSSDRPGGFGGRDLYITRKKENGMWSAPKNLGEKINTAYDDDAPFIHADGITFSFSSKGHNSIGGFDIFESRLINDSTFLEPRNMGFPINTTANDQFFFVSGKGNAYYSSSQEGGKGLHDIYVIDVSEIMTNSPVLLLKGSVIPESCTILVKNIEGEDRGTYKSDIKIGNYQFYLNLGEEYEITFKIDEEISKTIRVDTKDLSKYTERIENINFDRLEELTVVEETSIKPTFDLGNPDNFAMFLKKYGNVEVKEVVFKVQIGAYLTPENFTTRNWRNFGELERKKGEDGITRFTIGDYENFNKADKITKRARKIGDKDAFILVFYKGKRTKLNKLIAQGIYKI